MILLSKFKIGVNKLYIISPNQFKNPISISFIKKNNNVKVSINKRAAIIKEFLSNLYSRIPPYDNFLLLINIFFSSSISSKAIPVPLATQSKGLSAI